MAEKHGSRCSDDEFVVVETEIPAEGKTLTAPGDANNELELELHTTGRPDEMLVSIKPPKQPAGKLRHTPCDIVLIIDVSGSMNTVAELPDTVDELGCKESSGLSILDLVKHASRTILENLEDFDRLAIVTFSGEARVLQSLLPMTATNKAETWARIEQQGCHDITNLWAGIREGLKILESTATIGGVQQMFVLTDGVPNHMCPTQGYVKKLQPILRKMAEERGDAPLISTFGFGYYLKSALLRSIAEVGKGTYAFIPDAGMIGTVFVHAIANLFSTFATGCKLLLQSSNGAAQIHYRPYHEFDCEYDNDGARMHLGNILYGQSREVLIIIDNGFAHDIVTATFRYQPRMSPELLVETMGSLKQKVTYPQGELDYNISRNELCTFLSSLFSKNHNNEYVSHTCAVIDEQQKRMQLARLTANIERRLSEASKDNKADLANLQALLADVKPLHNDDDNPHGAGQISLALQTAAPEQPPPAYTSGSPTTGTSTRSSLARSSASSTASTLVNQPLRYRTYNPATGIRQSYYDRWGKHYIPSILHAHVRQMCLTFKDPGPLRYGVDSPLFIKCRDELDMAFDNLPPPKPSGRPRQNHGGIGYGGITGVPSHVGHQARGAGGTAAKRKGISMSRFNSASNPCFGGDSLVRMGNGAEYLKVSELRVRDIVWVPATDTCCGPGTGRMIRAIVRTEVVGQEMCRVRGLGRVEEGGELWVTPYHPVLVGSRWVFPTDITSGDEQKVLDSGYIYSVLLEQDNDLLAHVIDVGGVLCTTLGHGVVTAASGDEQHARAHPFFGDYEKIVESITALELDDCGRRVSGGIVKGMQGGEMLASRFIKPEERFDMLRSESTAKPRL